MAVKNKVVAQTARVVTKEVTTEAVVEAVVETAVPVVQEEKTVAVVVKKEINVEQLTKDLTENRNFPLKEATAREIAISISKQGFSYLRELSWLLSAPERNNLADKLSKKYT